MPQQVFEAHVNPLAFIEIDEPWATAIKSNPSVESVLRFLCPPESPSDLPTLIARYREISTEDVRLSIVPNEERISDKLVAPLRHAKASYMVGNFLATLALCGMVAEMLALLLWEMAETTINGQRMTTKEEENLFGRTFEKLGQDRRVKVLLTYGLISDRVRDDLELVRKTRNKYLHLWSQDHYELPKDAVSVFKAAVRVTVALLGQDIADGKFVLRPHLLKYLQRHGRVQVIGDSAAAESSNEDPAPSR
jgi:hypothetical protein